MAYDDDVSYSVFNERYPGDTISRPNVIAKLLGPESGRVVVAESLLMKQQLLAIDRFLQLVSSLDRFLVGFWALFLSLHLIPRAVFIMRPSTLLNFNEASIVIGKFGRDRVLHSNMSCHPERKLQELVPQTLINP